MMVRQLSLDTVRSLREDQKVKLATRKLKYMNLNNHILFCKKTNTGLVDLIVGLGRNDIASCKLPNEGRSRKTTDDKSDMLASAVSRQPSASPS